MSVLGTIRIDLVERFQHLPHAPIVEAVIDVRARAEVSWEEEAIQAQIKAQLPDYPQADSHREFRHEVKMVPGQEPQQTLLDLGWKGLRLRSSDKPHIAQFNRDGFVFSRLEPYQSWKQLYDESMRLWRMYIELARPVEIHRIGLRFINRIQLPPGESRLEDYMAPAPVPPRGLDLPFCGFMHQDTLVVPDYPYTINVIRTIQPPSAPGSAGLGLILDIDVFTTQGFELDEVSLEQRLLEMRWLKNKVFFGSVTPKALELFR